VRIIVAAAPRPADPTTGALTDAKARAELDNRPTPALGSRRTIEMSAS
jgi:hypothetical protein